MIEPIDLQITIDSTRFQQAMERLGASIRPFVESFRLANHQLRMAHDPAYRAAYERQQRRTRRRSGPPPLTAVDGHAYRQRQLARKRRRNP